MLYEWSRTHRIKNRTLAKFLANINHYFWMPCPNCGEMFAGYESSGGINWKNDGAVSVCNKPECVREAKLQTDRHYNYFLDFYKVKE